MKYLAIITLAALALTACATDPATVQTLVAAQKEANAQPTLSIKCPTGACSFGELSYTDPRDRAQLKMPTNGWDAMTSIGNNVTSLVPILVTGHIATAGFKALQNSGGVTTTTTTGATTNTGAVTTVGDSMSGTGVQGSGTYSAQANPVTTTPTPIVVPDTVVITPIAQPVVP